MRESEIRLFQAQSAKRSALMFRQFQFLDARIRAIESVFYTLGFWSRLWYIVFPRGLNSIIDSVHLKLLSEMESDYEEAEKKARTEASKPKLTIIGANGHV